MTKIFIIYTPYVRINIVNIVIGYHLRIFRKYRELFILHIVNQYDSN